MAAPATLPRAEASAQAVATGWPAGARAWLAAAVSLAAAGTALSSRRLAIDSFYDLYTGRLIMAHGIPHQNVATLAASGAPWTDQQWLAHVAYYGAWAAGGYPAVGALSAAMITAGFAVLALAMLRHGVRPRRMFAWTTAAFLVCLPNTQVAAESFGYPLFALTLWLVAEDSRSPGLRPRTWLVIPVLAAWANVHGSVLLGTGLTACYAACRAARALARRDGGTGAGYLMLGAAATLALICTPYGSGVLRYYGRFIGNRELSRHITAWMPLSPSSPFGLIFLVAALAMLAAAAVAWRRGARPDPLLAAVTLILLALALTAVRFAPWFAMAGSLLAAESLARSGGGLTPDLRPGFRAAIAGALAGLALVSLGTLATTTDRQFQSQSPSRAIAAASSLASRHPSLRSLGDDYSATAMLWLRPALLGRVGFDCRLEQYTSRDLRAYLDFIFVQGPRWQRVTRGYQLIVASRQRPGLVAALTGLPGWHVAYQDGKGVVFVR